MLDVSTINLYGVGDVRLRAVLDSSGALRWFIENEGSFSYDWTNKKLTNGNAAPAARLINIFRLQNATLTNLYCAYNNNVSISSREEPNSEIKWTIKFNRSRSGHKKKYLPIANWRYGMAAGITDITDTGFTVWGSGFMSIESSRQMIVTVCIFEYS
jgi:hypothetical protein